MGSESREKRKENGHILPINYS